MALRIVLKPGTTSSEALLLQEALIRNGFEAPKTGTYDETTGEIVVRFQRARGLVPDGIVGPKTWSALEGATSAAEPVTHFTCGDSRIALATVLQMCPGTPKSNILANLPKVLQELAARGLGYDAMISMAIATIYVETGSFVPLSEFNSRFNTSPGGRPFDLYDYRKDLGNQGPPDGERFRGRGFIQLTGRDNYRRYGTLLGVDLVSRPERANEPEIAASVLSEFLKARELRLAGAIRDGDFATARKLVNGGSHGLEKFSTALGVALKPTAQVA